MSAYVADKAVVIKVVNFLTHCALESDLDVKISLAYGMHDLNRQAVAERYREEMCPTEHFIVTDFLPVQERFSVADLVGGLVAFEHFLYNCAEGFVMDTSLFVHLSEWADELKASMKGNIGQYHFERLYNESLGCLH